VNLKCIYVPGAIYLRLKYEVLADPEVVQSLGLSAAGRTDAGVHARGQVVSFRIPLLAMSPLQVLLQHLATRLTTTRFDVNDIAS